MLTYTHSSRTLSLITKHEFIICTYRERGSPYQGFNSLLILVSSIYYIHTSPQQPLFQIFQILQILKCLKDPTYAIFLKSMGFKHNKYDIAVYQGGRSWQPFVHLKKSTKSFHGRRIFKFSRLGQLYQHPDGAYCPPMDVNRSMEPRHGRIIYHSRSCHLLSLL